MAAALDRTTTLTAEMMTYYEKRFLERARKKIILAQGAQKSSHGKNQGKSIVFTRYTPSTLATTALSEGANPSVTLLSNANVSCTLAEYGKTFKVSKFLSLTSIDKNNAEKIDLAAQNMGETINRLAGNALSGATSIYPNSKKISTCVASDTIDATDIRTVVKNLELNQAMAYDDGTFMGKVQPATKSSIVLDSTWINSKTYSDVKDLYLGEMGELYQVRFLLSTEKMSATGSGTAASDVTHYFNFIHGKEAFGTYDLEGDSPKLYILPNPVDSYNATGRYALVSWAGSYVATILNSNWVYNLRAPGS